MNAQADLLKETPLYQVFRAGRFLWVLLQQPASVLSTCYVNGGFRNDIKWLVNHQSIEGQGHTDRCQWIAGLSQEGYHHSVCRELDFTIGHTSIMGTAAQMQYAILREAEFEGAGVCAIVTAGVTGNAGRAGDPATWHESNGAYVPVPAIPGTINIILLFNCHLSPAALARSIVTLTEAKSAALAELAIPSKYSSHLATGTGTDQFCIAAPQSGKETYTWTGKHTKLGQLIGETVLLSVKEALRWQNGLEPSLTRDLVHALGRHGCQEGALKNFIQQKTSETSAQFFFQNWKSIVHDPQVSGCAYALAAIEDRFHYQTLPQLTRNELLAGQCALLAASLAAKPQSIEFFRQSLLQASCKTLLDWVGTSLILGWEHKWSSSSEETLFMSI